MTTIQEALQALDMLSGYAAAGHGVERRREVAALSAEVRDYLNDRGRPSAADTLAAIAADMRVVTNELRAPADAATVARMRGEDLRERLERLERTVGNVGNDVSVIRETVDRIATAAPLCRLCCAAGPPAPDGRCRDCGGVR